MICQEAATHWDPKSFTFFFLYFSGNQINFPLMSCKWFHFRAFTLPKATLYCSRKCLLPRATICGSGKRLLPKATICGSRKRQSVALGRDFFPKPKLGLCCINLCQRQYVKKKLCLHLFTGEKDIFDRENISFHTKQDKIGLLWCQSQIILNKFKTIINYKILAIWAKHSIMVELFPISIIHQC